MYSKSLEVSSAVIWLIITGHFSGPWMKCVFVVFISSLILMRDAVRDSHTIYPCEVPAAREERRVQALLPERKMQRNLFIRVSTELTLLKMFWFKKKKKARL